MACPDSTDGGLAWFHGSLVNSARPGSGTTRTSPCREAGRNRGFKTAGRRLSPGLLEAGYVEGANVEITYRYAEAQYDRLTALAAELVRRGAAVIFATGKRASALAAKAVTTTIPIVFVTDADPVELGVVGSLNRPGANDTGVTFLTTELTPKRLELLHETVPTVGSIGWVRNPALREAQIREVETAARTLGIHLAIANASTPGDIETASAMLSGRGSVPFWWVLTFVVNSPVGRRAVTCRQFIPSTVR